MTHFSPMTAMPGVVSSTYHAVSGALLANYWSNKPLNKEEKKELDMVNKIVTM